MSTLPCESTATPIGNASCALVATAASPFAPALPEPAIVEIVPSSSMRRMRWLRSSTISTRPCASIAMPYGLDSSAVVAAMPSPL